MLSNGILPSLKQQFSGRKQGLKEKSPKSIKIYVSMVCSSESKVISIPEQMEINAPYCRHN
jgi:hypothetical protein